MSWHLAKLASRLACVTTATVSLAALTAACAGTAAGRPASTPASTHDTTALSAASGASTAGAPKYFIDNPLFSGSVSGSFPQVRLATTGSLAAQPAGVMDYGIAALGSRGTFVIAEVAGSGCGSTRLYRAALGASGKLGKLYRLGTVPDAVVSLTADADGNAVGFTAGCYVKSPSSHGYLGVLDLRTGALRRWGSVGVAESAGTIRVGALSMSANGGLVAFTGSTATADGVWLLKTTSAAGQLAKHSRLALRTPLAGQGLGSVALTPGGTSFYLCTVDASQASSFSVAVAQYRTSDGRMTKTIAILTVRGSTFQDMVGCPMAADPSGADLLVPYALQAGSKPEIGPLVRMARIHVATDSVQKLSFRLPGSAGMSVAVGLSIAW